MGDEDKFLQRDSALREGKEKQLRFLQDIPQDQRTQRHSMHMEYSILSDKCAEIREMAAEAMSRGEPFHVTATKLGDPVAYHALLARMFFCSQVGPLYTQARYLSSVGDRRARI